MIALLLLLVGGEVDSKVDSVVIYSDRVLVTRVAEVYLDKTADLIFADLPGALDDASVRINAEGLRVGEVQVKTGYTEKPHPKVKGLEDSLKILEIADRALSDEMTVLQEKEKFLQSIAVGGPEVVSKEIISGKVAPEAWRQGLYFMADELLNTKRREAEVERSRVELQEKINALRRELNDIRSITANRKSITFDCHPDVARSYKIRVSYILHGAGWRTYFELRADPSAREIDVSYFGKIVQRTNEDWENTKIVLSTARPAAGGATPTPAPWYIQTRKIPVQGLMYREEAAAAIVSAPASEEALVPAPPVEAGVSVWYPLPGRYSIKSGEPERKIQLYEAVFEGDFEYFVIPRITLLAYSTGRLKNSSDYLFLAGEASTYVGDDFTGKTYLPTIALDESTTVSFGIDDRVRVVRELKKSKVSHGGLFSSKTKYEFTYENRVNNFHNKDIACTIVDQVPVPQDPDIKVSALRFEPESTEENKDQGIYYWRVPIGPKKEFQITVSFTVEAPGDKDIEGLMP